MNELSRLIVYDVYVTLASSTMLTVVFSASVKGHFHYGCAALRFASLRCAALR